MAELNTLYKNGYLNAQLLVIGHIRSPLRDLASCPHWQNEGPPAALEILPPYREALDGIKEGQEISILTWLHLADRSTLIRRKSPQDPPRGVFNTRSPARPNPIGLHTSQVTALDLQAKYPLVRVKALEALDGTPILDIKVEREQSGEASPPFLVTLNQTWPLLADLCRRAGEKACMPGFSGNASLRVNDLCLLTRREAIKSSLNIGDFAALRIEDGSLLPWGSTPSSDFPMHLEIYRRQPMARIILHTHPPSLQALGIRFPGQSMEARLDMPLFEAQSLRKRIITLPRLPPGGISLGQAAGEAAATGKNIIWMEEHGLCVWGLTSEKVLALTEEIEHLAQVALWMQKA